MLFVVGVSLVVTLVVRLGAIELGGDGREVTIADDDQPRDAVHVDSPAPRSTPRASATRSTPAIRPTPTRSTKPTVRATAGTPVAPRPSATTAPPKPPPPPGPPPPVAATYYLRSSGTGNRTSSATLPMSTARPTATALANFDTDRNGDPGLTVRRGGVNPGEVDRAKVQVWSITAGATIRLKGAARLVVTSTLSNLQNKRGGLVVTLRDCSSAGACTTIGSGSVQRQKWGGAWMNDTVALGTIDRTIAAGRRIQVVVTVTGNAQGDMWLAYDTTSYASALRIG